MSVQSEPALDFSPQPPRSVSSAVLCPHTLTRAQTRLWLCVQGPHPKPPVGTWPSGVRAVVVRRGSGPDLPVCTREQETQCL